jgi:hypothetical protein
VTVPSRAALPCLLAACALALFALALFAQALRGAGDPLSPQSLANLHFASTPRYAAAIGELSRVWPPLYPSVLWLFAAFGIPPLAVNGGLFAAGVALLVPLGRRVAPAVHPAWWAALYAVSGFHLENLQQLVSEALLVPLSLGLLLAAIRCSERGAAADYALVGVLLAACCLTRYFALAWLAPAVFAALALRAPAPLATRAARAGATVLASALPVLGWMLHARLSTGFSTGMDRFSPRIFAGKTTLLENLVHTARTLFVDWFSPSQSGSHAAVGSEWRLEPAAAAVAVVAGVLVLACARAAMRARPGTGARAGAIVFLLPGFSLGYVACLLVLWTAGNNDPIYSRFLYPSYVFFGLSAAHVYSHVKSSGEAGARRPFQALYVWMLAAQLAGTARLLASGSGAAATSP